MDIDIKNKKMVIHSQLLVGNYYTVDTASLSCNSHNKHGKLVFDGKKFDYIHVDYASDSKGDTYLGFVRPFSPDAAPYSESLWHFVNIRVPPLSPVEQKIKEIADKYSKNFPEASNIRFDLEQLVKEAKKQP